MKCLLSNNPSAAEINDQPEFPDFDHKDCMLVCVGVQVLSKGVPDARSTLSFPTEQDLNNIYLEMTDLYKYGLASVSGPVEEKHDDPYRKERLVAGGGYGGNPGSLCASNNLNMKTTTS